MAIAIDYSSLKNISIYANFMQGGSTVKICAMVMIQVFETIA